MSAAVRVRRLSDHEGRQLQQIVRRGGGKSQKSAYLGENNERVVVVGHERFRQILVARDVTFQRTKSWKESNDPERDIKLDRIEHVVEHYPDRCFAFDEFGPLTIRPVGGCTNADTNL